MATGTEIGIIIAVIVLIIIAIIAIIVVYFLIRGKSCTPGTTVNAFSCTANSDCISCNCNNGFCQPSNQTTGTAGASCSAKGASCNSGLSCNSSGICVDVPPPSPPTEGKNGSACTTDSDCLSQFCSPDVTNPGNSFCQPQGTASGTLNSYCGGGATCQLGLSCEVINGVNVCASAPSPPPSPPPTPPPGTGGKNGVQCSTASDCTSGNCSLNPISNVKFCQPAQISSGSEGSVCAGTGSQNDCLSGALCSQGQCVINTLGKFPFTQQCSSDSDCAATMICTANEITKGKTYCSYPQLNLGEQYSPVNGVCPPNSLPLNQKCLASSNQFCSSDSQCASGTCNTSKWGLWSVLSSNQFPSWRYLNTWPGQVQKLMAFNSLSGDNLVALIPEGSSPGLYLYNGGSNNFSLIKALNAPGCGVNGGTIVNFSVSNDGSLIYIAVAGLSGTYSISKNGTDVSGPIVADYTGVFEVQLQGQETNCNPLEIPTIPSGLIEYTINTLQAPGMVMGPANFVDTPINEGTSSIKNIPVDLPPNNFFSAENNQNNISPDVLNQDFNYFLPVTDIIDMDIVFNAFSAAVTVPQNLTQNPGQLIIHGASKYLGGGSYFLAYPLVLLPCITCGSGINTYNYPQIRTSQTQITMLGYCSCDGQCALSDGLCTDSSKGILLQNPGCVGSTNPHNGMCYLQSAKTVRSYYSPGSRATSLQNIGFLNPGPPTPVTVTQQTIELMGLQVVAPPVFNEPLANPDLFPGVFLPNLQTFAGSTAGVYATGYQSILIFGGENFNSTLPAWLSEFWLIDFDVFTTTLSNFTFDGAGLEPESCTAGATHGIFYIRTKTGNDYRLLYVPNVEGSNFSSSQCVYLGLPTEIGQFPGYLPSTGRVAAGKSTLFYTGPGICG